MLGPMQTLYVVVASASGLALGYAAASHLASNAKAALMAKLSDESSALKEAQAKLKQLKAGESKGSGKGGGGGGGGKGKNKKSPDKDIKKFEKQVADANRELERLKDSQMATDKAHADALAKVEAQLASAMADTAKAVEEAKEQAASAAPAEASEAGEVANAELIAALGSAGASLDGILETLIQHEGQTGALLGDINGIVVAKAGDSDTVENTAAASNTLVSLPQKLQGMLPMNQHFGFELHDGENAISGQTFESEGELLALTTVGTTAPNEASLQAVIDSVKAALT